MNDTALLRLSDLLPPAEARRYAVGSFCYCNAETAQAIGETAVKLRSPVIIMTGPDEVPLLGARALVEIAESIASRADVPICLHLDHAYDLALVEECIAAGFPSVMIDASRFDFEENVRLTKLAVEMARPKGVSVEGELGAVGRVDDTVVEGGKAASLTDPERAAEFVERTGIDALAVAIGNAHGIYTQQPTLDFDRLEAIKKATNVPLVLHGGSGTPLDQLHRAIGIGISKVNVASELSRAYVNAIQQRDGKVWFAHALVDAKAACAGVVAQWMEKLGSVGRA